jgi:hypothetical protein
VAHVVSAAVTPRRRRRGGGEGDRSRRPLPPIYPTLDLHGSTEEEAVRRAERWLVARRGEGERTVVLVTGRGLHSIGPAVLPNAIQQLLRRLKGTVVQEFEAQPGGGAYRVVLRRPSSDPPAAPDQARLLDPELEREALDSLAELGIAPTPAVIRAEVERLRAERRRGAQ